MRLRSSTASVAMLLVAASGGAAPPANERARRVYERLGYTPETLRYVKPL